MSYLGPPDPVHQQSSKVRVLHVDDQPSIAELTAEFLKRESDAIEVVTATSARDGLERLVGERIDCIVSDYDMPGQNGLEFLERIREEHGDLPFVLFTGKGSEEIASEAISAGVTDYLQKETGTDQYTVLANRIENAVQQHRSQRAVEATEEKLSQIAERTDDVLFMIDGDWNELLFVNSAYEEVWGGSVTELREDPTQVLEYAHPDDREAVDRSMERLQRGESDAVEYRVVPEDGDQRWVHAETKPILDDDGNLSRITGFVRDITERKTREEELRARATAMEAATDGIAILDENQEYVFMNEAHAEVYGFDDPAKLLGESWRACYDATEISRFESEILPRLVESGFWEGDITVTASDGRTVHQHLVLQQLEDGRVVCVVRDVTDQREREREIERVHDLLEKTEHIADVGGWEIDTETMDVFWTEHLFDLLEAPYDEEPPLDEALDIYHEDDRAVVENAVETALDSGEPFDVEVRFRTPDGEVRWLRVQGVPVTEDDEVVTLRGAVQDVTERRNHERELKRQNERLDEFVSVVSHDLRNPLTVADGRLDLVREECDSDHLEDVERAHERMSALVDDLLTLARDGDRVSELERVDLEALVRDSWRHVPTAGATLVADLDREIRADPGRLRQLLENLVRNAVKHGSTPPDVRARQDAVEHGDVTVTAGELDDGFYVEDDGEGIPAGDRERVFEAGYSTLEEGTGFGLSIVREVANAHGWNVRATESAVGGARFEITGVERVDR